MLVSRYSHILMFRRPVIQICSIFARKVSGLIVIRSFFGYHPRLRCNYTKDWGSLTKDAVSKVVVDAVESRKKEEGSFVTDDPSAVAIQVSNEAFELLEKHWEAVSDEHRVQLLLKSLG